MAEHLPGGLANTNLVNCAFLTAVRGSSTATAVPVGIPAIPPMLKNGYDRKKVMGLVAAGGTLGILIPPSGPLIIYGAITYMSVGKLFIAGILPGMMVCLIYIAFPPKFARKQTGRLGWRTLGPRVVESSWTNIVSPITQ